MNGPDLRHSLHHYVICLEHTHAHKTEFLKHTHTVSHTHTHTVSLSLSHTHRNKHTHRGGEGEKLSGTRLFVYISPKPEVYLLHTSNK